MHTECPKSTAEILQEMPTDKDIEILRSTYGIRVEDIGAPREWGNSYVWGELHFETRFPNTIDY